MKATMEKIELTGNEVEVLIKIRATVEDYSDGYATGKLSEQVRREIKDYLVEQLIAKHGSDLLERIDIVSLKNAVMLKTANIMVRGE